MLRSLEGFTVHNAGRNPVETAHTHTGASAGPGLKHERPMRRTKKTGDKRKAKWEARNRSLKKERFLART